MSAAPPSLSMIDHMFYRSLLMLALGLLIGASGFAQSHSPQPASGDKWGEVNTLYAAYFREQNSAPVLGLDSPNDRAHRIARALERRLREAIISDPGDRALKARSMLDALAQAGAFPDRPATPEEIETWLREEVKRVFSPTSTAEANDVVYQAVRATLDVAEKATLASIDAKLRGGRTIREFYGWDLRGARDFLLQRLGSLATDFELGAWGVIARDAEAELDAMQAVVDDLLPRHKRHLLRADHLNEDRRRLAKDAPSFVDQLGKLLETMVGSQHGKEESPSVLIGAALRLQQALGPFEIEAGGGQIVGLNRTLGRLAKVDALIPGAPVPKLAPHPLTPNDFAKSLIDPQGGLLSDKLAFPSVTVQADSSNPARALANQLVDLVRRSETDDLSDRALGEIVQLLESSQAELVKRMIGDQLVGVDISKLATNYLFTDRREAAERSAGSQGGAR